MRNATINRVINLKVEQVKETGKIYSMFDMVKHCSRYIYTNKNGHLTLKRQ